MPEIRTGGQVIFRILKVSDVLPSLFPRCDHHLVFTKLNFKVSFSPAYKRRVWDFSRANIPAIQQAITGINWNTAFIGLNVYKRIHS